MEAPEWCQTVFKVLLGIFAYVGHNGVELASENNLKGVNRRWQNLVNN